jgi:hypothetical protein
MPSRDPTDADAGIPEMSMNADSRDSTKEVLMRELEIRKLESEIDKLERGPWYRDPGLRMFLLTITIGIFAVSAYRAVDYREELAKLEVDVRDLKRSIGEEQAGVASVLSANRDSESRFIGDVVIRLNGEPQQDVNGSVRYDFFVETKSSSSVLASIRQTSGAPSIESLYASGIISFDGKKGVRLSITCSERPKPESNARVVVTILQAGLDADSMGSPEPFIE